MGEDRAPNVGGRHVDSAQEDAKGLSEKTIRLRAKAQRAGMARERDGTESTQPPGHPSGEHEK